VSPENEFFEAVGSGELERVRALAEAHPDLAARRRDGATALHSAAIAGNQPVADLLIDLGADLNTRDDEHGAKPAGWANEKGHAQLVVHLVARGTDVTLCEAAGWGLADHVTAQLANDSSNIDEHHGFGSALHYAAVWGHDQIVDQLLAAGADPSARSIEGLTAVELARSQVETDGQRTTIVLPERRREILAGCRRIIDHLDPP